MKPGVIVSIIILITANLFASDFSKLKMINSGVGGNNTRQGLKRFTKDVLNFKPAIAIIFFGMNDAVNDHNSVPLPEFKKNIAKMIDLSKKNNVKTILVTVHPIMETKLYQRHKDNLQKFYLNRGGANKIIASYNQAIRELAKENQVPLVDFYQKAKTVNPEFSSNLITGSDGVHLCENGKKVLAQLVVEKLKKIAKGNETIVCFGDSITEFDYSTEVLRILDSKRFPTYTTSVTPSDNHPDTTPPLMLFDGNFKNISNHSVEYSDDVEIIVDLQKSEDLESIELIAFNGENYRLNEVELFVGNRQDSLKRSGSLKNKEDAGREAQIFKFGVNEKIRFIKLRVKKSKNSKRILLSEIRIQKANNLSEKKSEEL
jgi:lysophospholipase L1-like esterase